MRAACAFDKPAASSSFQVSCIEELVAEQVHRARHKRPGTVSCLQSKARLSSPRVTVAFVPKTQTYFLLDKSAAVTSFAADNTNSKVLTCTSATKTMSVPIGTKSSVTALLGECTI